MGSSKKTIAVATGIRSEYHILQPVMRAIEEHPLLKLQVIVTGTHLSKKFGLTWKEVAKDFPITLKVPSLPSGDSLPDRLKGLSRQVAGFSQHFGKLHPDIVCVLGDREESLSVATTCAYLNLPCAHLSGGDRGTGTVDDSVRHAVSKLAHLHFPTTKENKKRLIRLGEEPWRIHAVGASGLDRLRQVKKISRKKLLQEFGLEDQDFVVILQHPVSSEVSMAPSQIKKTLEAIKRSGLAALIVHPNSDPGAQAMIRAIHDFKKPPHWRVHTTLHGLQWANALRHAVALVGNSSAGLLEAPYLACPAINIGLRQTERTGGQNLLRVPHQTQKILEALKYCQKDSFRKKLKERKHRTIYGSGNTGPKIAKILAQTTIDKRLLNKRITY